ncbi:MAG: 7TM diverse intracellular signaling domain-containing protein [Hydrogenophaga sp.]|uniref:sensor domain-containing diguanylate cyclase n=1 Tax=Hydrogenophaga sp. TaxID=1904254 RepID=UPI00272F962D|nr:7TM diverse intracellular signaling domain-containing protein [Hydrogenophaga sp.]MDP2249082.1 7TM diverse intracellular signaling domain-containing protein [Hydrogenophaga sp.]
MTFLVRLCALCALLLSLHAAHAQPGPQPAPLSLDGSKSTLSLAGRSSFWVDGGGQLTVDQLEQLQAELPFSIRNRDNRLQLGPGAVLWVKFDARVVDTGTQWELELTHAGTDLVSLFHRQADGSWKAQHAGDRIAVRDWAYPDRYPVFALDPRADQTVTYWVRIEHARVPFSGELLVHNHSALRELRIQQQFLLGAYFGMAFLLVATAVANALVFRDTSFAAYAVYVTVLALALSASLGVGGQFIWPGWPRWNGLAEFVLLPLTAVTGLLFVRHVVQPRRIGRGLDRLALTLAGVFLALTVWDVLHPTATSLQALTAIGALTMALVYAMLWAAWRTGDRWVRWIALGILPVLLAGTLPVLRNFGLLSSGFLSQYGMVLAAVIEAPLLIYGLLQRSSVQHEAQTRARALALTEPLTGLTNRHNFMLRLHESLVRAQRYQHHSALLLIDLDNHGWFAETHGREVADRALVLTGSLLRSVARDVDTAGRVNDSTLALLMEGPVREAQVVAAATSIVAGGLRPSSQLPVGATLKFKVVLALLPDAASGADLESNAQAHLDWLGSGLDALRQDGRRTILKLNF